MLFARINKVSYFVFVFERGDTHIHIRGPSFVLSLFVRFVLAEYLGYSARCTLSEIGIFSSVKSIGTRFVFSLFSDWFLGQSGIPFGVPNLYRNQTCNSNLVWIVWPHSLDLDPEFPADWFQINRKSMNTIVFRSNQWFLFLMRFHCHYIP